MLRPMLAPCRMSMNDITSLLANVDRSASATQTSQAADKTRLDTIETGATPRQLPCPGTSPSAGLSAPESGHAVRYRLDIAVHPMTQPPEPGAVCIEPRDAPGLLQTLAGLLSAFQLLRRLWVQIPTLCRNIWQLTVNLGHMLHTFNAS